MTQFEAVAHYLRLAVWPQVLIFDYGVAWTKEPRDVFPYVVVVVGLVATTVVLLVRLRALGVAAALFFFTLAPTSLVPGNRQTLAEHRMYLALIAVVIAGTLGTGWLLRRALGDLLDSTRWRIAGVLIVVVIACGLGLQTARRNAVYRDEIVLWRDTAAKRPENPWAHNGLGVALYNKDRLEEAKVELLAALRLSPGQSMIECNLGNVLNRQGNIPESIVHYQLALRTDSNLAQIHYNLADALSKTPGGGGDAIREYQEAVRLRPSYVEARHNLAMAEFELANTLRGQRQLEEAILHYQQALLQKPDFFDCLNNLGATEAITGHQEDAIVHFRAALRIKPDFADARRNLGIAERAVNRSRKVRP